jgi:hypothetical protein
MIAKLARALPPNCYLEIYPSKGDGMAAFLMEERPSGDQGDLVVGRTVALDDRAFEVLTCHMVGVEPTPRLDGYTFRVTRSDEEFVGRCAEFPSLSWLAKSEADALFGIAKLVADARSDMASRQKEVPDPLPFGERLSAEELEAIAYVRDLVQVNRLAGCQDAVSKRHTKMVDLFKGAADKLLDGG